MRAPPNIVFASTQLGGFPGLYESALDMIRSLVQTGCALTVISRDDAEAVRARLGADVSGVSWLREPGVASLHPVVDRTLPGRVCRWIGDARRVSAFRRAVGALAPDLVIANDVGSHRMLEDIRNWIHCRRAFILRLEPSMYTGVFSLPGMSLKRVVGELSGYDHLISVSERVLAHWKQIPELSHIPGHYLPNCCDEPEVAQYRERDRLASRRVLGLPDDMFMVACVGSVDWRKGQDLLLANFEALQRRIPNVKMYFVGPVHERWRGHEVVERLHKQPFKGHVVHTGARPDALAFMRAANVVVLPTRAEGMPRTVLEAMAMGTPVVASDVSGIPEMITHEQEGLLFSHDAPDLMVEHIARVYEQPDWAEAAVAHARAKYWSHFSRARHAERLRQLVATLCPDTEPVGR
jgi:glycosyltransferase involved in cell wall biosynthesis